MSTVRDPRVRRWAGAVLGLGLLALAASGLVQAERSTPRTLEQRVDAVAAGLRCPSCEGSSVADAPASVSDGARETIREQLQAGRSPEQVREWFVERYGEWVLLSPSRSGSGAVLWVLPVVGLGAVAALVGLRLRRRGAAAPEDGGAASDDGDDVPARHGPEADTSGEKPPAPPAHRARGSAGSGRNPNRHSTRRPRRHRRGALVARVVAVMASVSVAGTLLATEVEPRDEGAAGGQQLAVAAGGPAGDGGVDEAALARARTELQPLKDAADARPTDIAAQSALANGLAAYGHPQEGIDVLERAVVVTQGDGEAVRALAVLLLQHARADDARVALTKLLERDPGDPDAILLLAVAQAASGEPADATLRAFLAAAPDHPRAADARALLEAEQASATPDAGGQP